MRYRVESIVIDSVEDLHEMAGLIAGLAQPGAIFGLVGPLGAGKTEFVRGLMRSFGRERFVSSPSYVLENLYDVPVSAGAGTPDGIVGVRHLDLYRLPSGSQVGELLDISHGDRALTLIEWIDRLQGWEDFVDVVLSLQFGADPTLRYLSLMSYSDTGDSLVESVSGQLQKTSARDERVSV